MSEKINKAYSIVGIIRRNFKFLDRDMLIVFGHHIQFKIKKNVEKVQMRASKLIQEIKHMSKIDRLKNLNLPTLLYRRLRGDMIMVYKLLSGLYYYYH